MIFQFKRFLSLLLVILVLISSLTVPAFAADEVYSVTDDTTVISPAIYYTEGYYPGLVAEMRNSLTFANSNIAHGSYSSGNYSPTYSYRNGSLFNLDLPLYYPSVIADHSDVSAVATVPNTSLVSGSLLTVKLPASNDAYFDFQSSNFLFDQQSPDANTFYVNGDLTFNLRNLWSFSGSPSSASFYLASDPLAVQLLIDGKPYGDIIDVTGYTSPFTSLYGGAVPANATVHFDNMKVYYQGDTPDMIGFRVLTGSAFTDGSYLYNDGGDFTAVSITNTVTFRCSELPDITFVQEGGDGYAGDLSGISGLLSDISGKLNGGLVSVVNAIKGAFYWANGVNAYLGSTGYIMSTEGTLYLGDLIRFGFLGLRFLMVDSSGVPYFKTILSQLTSSGGSHFLLRDGSVITLSSDSGISYIVQQGLLGLRSSLISGSGSGFLNANGDKVASSGVLHLTDMVRVGILGLHSQMVDAQSYVADTVFPWQSYNMETHQLNAATNITGQNNLFFTAFQSIEDKLGRLAYVFGSDEDLALKDDADPGTDAFRENFGGGASLSQISDGADVVEGIDGLFDSGYDFGDAFTEISGESMFTMWFSAENAAAVDSTGSVMSLDDSDPYNMQIYYDRLQEVAEKRDWGSD